MSKKFCQKYGVRKKDNKGGWPYRGRDCLKKGGSNLLPTMGLFAIAFTTDALNRLSPVDCCFDVSLMLSHLLQCLETEQLTVFPRTPKRI